MIITISRGSFSGGAVVAECVAEQLNYRVVSREILAAAAARNGVAEARLAEALDRAPGLWERLGHDRRLYLAFIREALLDVAVADDVVYHGHAGHLLLRGLSHVLRVRLVAPLPFRISAVMERMHFGREQAEDYIRRVDEERARWTRFLYGIDWKSPLVYDLVINLESMGVPGACAVVRATAGLPTYQVTDASRTAVRDLALAGRVEAALARDPATARLECEATASSGAVTLRGGARDGDVVEAAMGLVARMPGVCSVRWERPSARPGL